MQKNYLIVIGYVKNWTGTGTEDSFNVGLPQQTQRVKFVSTESTILKPPANQQQMI